MSATGPVLRAAQGAEASLQQELHAQLLAALHKPLLLSRQNETALCTLFDQVLPFLDLGGIMAGIQQAFNDFPGWAKTPQLGGRHHQIVHLVGSWFMDKAFTSSRRGADADAEITPSQAAAMSAAMRKAGTSSVAQSPFFERGAPRSNRAPPAQSQPFHLGPK